MTKLINSLKKYQEYFLAFFILFFNIFILSILLSSDYYNDDVFNMQVPGFIPLKFDSVFELTKHYLFHWLDTEGRFFPAAWYLYYVFWIFDTLLSYKFFIISLVETSIFLFAYFIYDLSKNKKYAYLIILLSPIIFQFRAYSDPILSFHGLLQVLFIYLIMSLILLNKYLNDSKLIYLFGSLVFYLFALITYEISYVFLVFHVILLSFNKTKHNRYVWLLPYFFTLIVVIGITLYFRSLASGIAESYTPNFDVISIVTTYFYQVVSAFPLSYNIPLYHSIFPIQSFVKDMTFYDLMMALCLTAILAILLKKKDDIETRQTRKILFLLSIGLILLPGSMIALSPKFQSQLSFGIGYLPVFFQYFGIVLLIILSFSFISQSSKKTPKIILIVSLVIVLLNHLHNNRLTIEKLNEQNKYQRELLINFFNSAQFQNIPEKSTIIYKNYSPYHNSEFLYMNTKKEYIVIDDVLKVKKVLKNNFLLDYRVFNLHSKKKRFASINCSNINDKKNKPITLYKYDKNIWKKLATYNGISKWEFGEDKELIYAWVYDDVSIELLNEQDKDLKVKFNFEVSSESNQILQVTFNQELLDKYNMLTNSTKMINKEVNLKPGVNYLYITTNNKKDDKNIRFGITRINIEE